ncbi:WD40-repeat-containing domain protein [Phlyctochytrium arcticum]|nr:WD40-repeat-containing domain protein [Phlyctochytrium arcticum]
MCCAAIYPKVTQMKLFGRNIPGIVRGMSSGCPALFDFSSALGSTMLLLGIPWISHTNDKRHKTPIYSLAVHPQGGKLATGGQDSKVKLWNLAPVHDEKLENDPDTPKLLATLSAHSGTILCTRWANDHGQFLASGADDCKIVIWAQDRSSGFLHNTFGEVESTRAVESWRAFKVLIGHESDVADLAWSPDNKYLASCGFETNVYIWDGQTFERLRKLQSHTAFVKGVTWDPVGKYLATQGDDKTTKIWRISDWAVEKDICEPYEAAASTTFFRRLSWSPDGNCIVTANGENGNIPVAPIIQRDGWKTDVSLVGHEAPIECAQFNPLLFKAPSNAIESGSDHSQREVSAVCAIGSQDHTISIWWTGTARAITASKSLFKHSILDMSWAPDGLCLFACSYDGTVGVLSFEPGTFGDSLAPDEKDQILSSLGVKRKVVLESPRQMELEEQEKLGRIANLLGPQEGPSTILAEKDPQRPLKQVSKKPASPSPIPLKQSVTTTPDGRKRIRPTFLSSGFDGSSPVLSTNYADVAPDDMTTNAGVQANSSGSIPMGTSKRQRTSNDQDDPTNERLNETSIEYILPTVVDAGPLPNLAVPSVKPRLMTQIPLGTGADTRILSVECENSKRGCKVTCMEGAEQRWSEALHGQILRVSGTPFFVACATLEGFLHIFSVAGRRLLPPLALEGPPSFLASQGHYLMVLTSIGTVTVWDVVKQRTAIRSTSIVHILRSNRPSSEPKIASQDVIIRNVTLRPEGIPILTTSAAESFSYHPEMAVWMKIEDPAEGHVSHLFAGNGKSREMSTTSSHIENQLASHLCLRSPVDYRTWIRRYARCLSDEGAVTKVKELCDDLLGPSSRSSFDVQVKDSNVWDPMILGMPKRSLLRELIPILGLLYPEYNSRILMSHHCAAHNRNLQRIVIKYKESLDNMHQHENLAQLRI